MPLFIRNYLRAVYHLYHLVAWSLKGRPIPANSYVKRTLVRKQFSNSSCHTFIETGTLHGRMLEAICPYANHLYSIELSESHFKRASKKFKDNKKVNLIYGDSGKKLASVLSSITEPAFFWLDAHFSDGTTAKAEIDTPIVEELKAILAHHIKNHIIWIDDARCFDGTHDYPTLNEIEKLVSKQYTMKVSADIIRLVSI